MVSTVTAAAYLTFKVRINVTLRMFGTLVSSYVHTSCAHFLHPHFLCDHAFAHICTLVTSYLDTCQLLCTVDHTFAHICTLVTSYLDTRQRLCTVYAQYTHFISNRVMRKSTPLQKVGRERNETSPFGETKTWRSYRFPSDPKQIGK